MNADTIRKWIRQAINDGLARESDDGKLHMDGVKGLLPTNSSPPKNSIQ